MNEFLNEYLNQIFSQIPLRNKSFGETSGLQDH